MRLNTFEKEGLMENTLYEYSPIITRKAFELPGKARVAFWVGLAIEYFAIDATEFGGVGQFKVSPPNVHEFAPRDYGNRIGVWRLMEVLDKHNIKASVFLNSDVCDQYPIIIEECKKRKWEFVAHSTSNAVLLGGKSEAEERKIIKTTIDVITRSTGQRPIGWIGAALQETFNTPNILAEEGIKYVSDWACDEQPFPMKVKKGSLIAMPYTVDLNDIPAYIMQRLTPEKFYAMIKDQFDVLYREGARQPRVMCIALHPFLSGLPFRIGWVDKALEYIKSHKDVWFATSGEIAAWYYKKYLGTSIA